jgi:cell division protein FtsB
MYQPGREHKNYNTKNGEEVFFKVLKVISLIALCVILIFSVYKLYRKYTKAHRALTDSQLELAKLQENEREINQSIDRLSTPAGIEYEVRDKYRVTKENEKMILVIDNKPPAENKILQKNIFVKFKEWLYNL